MKKRRDSINSNKSNRSNFSNKSNTSKNNKYKLQKNKIKKEKVIKKDNENKIISDDNLEENNNTKKDIFEDDLEKEINYLEGKLKLKDKKEFEKFNKRITMENYDSDLMDFLGNIDSVMNMDKEKYLKKKELKNKETKVEKKEDLKDKTKETKKITKIKIIKETNNDKIKKEEPKSMFKKDNNKEITREERINKFQRELNSLINKIAESNISFLIPDMFNKIDEFNKNIKDNFILFDIITKISLKLLLNQEITNLPITSCVCTFIS
jgi:hypothetical protein